MYDFFNEVSPNGDCRWYQQLFKHQSDFFDIPCSKLTPIQIREKLVDLALPIVGQDKKGELLDLLTYKTTPNGGVDVTEDLKYTSKIRN